MFSLMVLILTVGGVAALLSRSVFKPIRTLTDFTDRAADGNLVDSFPPIGGELEQLADNFRRLILRYNDVVARFQQSMRDAGQDPARADIYSSTPDGDISQESAHDIDIRYPTPGKGSGSGSSQPGSQEEDP